MPSRVRRLVRNDTCRLARFIFLFRDFHFALIRLSNVLDFPRAVRVAGGSGGRAEETASRPEHPEPNATMRDPSADDTALERPPPLSHAALLEAIDTLPDGFVVYDADDRLVLCNRAFRDLNPEIADLIRPGAAFSDLVAAKIAAARRGDDGDRRLRCGVDCNPACRDWSPCRERVHAHPGQPMFETTADGRWIRVDEHRTPSGLTVGLRTDLSGLRLVRTELARSEAKFRTLYAMAPLGIVRTDADGRIVDANPAFAVITGSSPDDPRAFAELFDPRDRAAVATDLATAVADAAYGPVERRLVGPDGGEVTLWLQGTRVDGPDGAVSLWSILQDISERKRGEARIRHAALHDVLTGLPNRQYLSERLTARLDAGEPTALLLVDLDNFKQVNDTLGHEAGDVLLRAVAARLREGVREIDLVARLGGDEFAVVLEGIADADEVRRITERLFETLGGEILHRGRSIRVGASIGMALAPDHAVEAGEVLRFADLALYEAKRAGRNRAVMFDPVMQAISRRRFDVEAATRRALDEDRIVPFYQPIVDLDGGRLHGLEALCRVSGDGAARLTPAEIFRDRELAREVDQRMIERVTADMARWRDAGFDFGRVAINVCDQDLWSPDFEGHILGALARHDLDPHRLAVEITETALLEPGDTTLAPRLARLAAAGPTIALDDFGTGWASLIHLRTLPIDQIKIDRTFVADVVFDVASRAIVETLVSLGAALGKEVVAEGVETAGQRRALLDLGCRLAQGHHLGRPIAAADVIARWRRSGDTPAARPSRAARRRVV